MIFLIIACIVLFLLSLWLIIYIIRLKNAMREIKKELILTRDMQYNRQITIDLIDDTLSETTAEINRTLDYQKQLKYETAAAERTLKQSVSDIAHDLRTPLTVINGNLQMLRREEGLSEKGSEYVRIIEEKCAAMKVMADDFFELSVLESDSSEVQLNRVNMTNVLMQFLADNEAVICGNGLTPEVILPEKTVFALADESLLMRMLGNLLNNIVKYAKDSFKLCLSAENGICEITFSNRVDIEDIPDTDRLFERTYRADKARQGGGAGLGLYIVKLLAKKQSGTVSAEYKKGELNISVKLKTE